MIIYINERLFSIIKCTRLINCARFVSLPYIYFFTIFYTCNQEQRYCQHLQSKQSILHVRLRYFYSKFRLFTLIIWKSFFSHIFVSFINKRLVFIILCQQATIFLVGSIHSILFLLVPSFINFI